VRYYARVRRFFMGPRNQPHQTDPRQPEASEGKGPQTHRLLQHRSIECGEFGIARSNCLFCCCELNNRAQIFGCRNSCHR
jgi:hypothetical protein